MKIAHLALRSLLVVAKIATPLAGYSIASTASASDGLPAPQISRALDALLVPINKATREKFNIAPGEHGVLVLSVKDGGVADAQGIKPGGVISEVEGHKVHKPIDVDIAVRRSLKASDTNIPFGVIRDGAPVAVATVITEESYSETISVSEVSSWESETSSSFSYSEYISEESSEIESSYESEEATVEEQSSQEASASEEESSNEMDDGGSDEAGDDAGGDDGGDDGDGE